MFNFGQNRQNDEAEIRPAISQLTVLCALIKNTLSTNHMPLSAPYLSQRIRYWTSEYLARAINKLITHQLTSKRFLTTLIRPPPPPPPTQTKKIGSPSYYSAQNPLVCLVRSCVTPGNISTCTYLRHFLFEEVNVVEVS